MTASTAHLPSVVHPAVDDDRYWLSSDHCADPVLELLHTLGWAVVDTPQANVHATSPDGRVYVGWLPEDPTAWKRGIVWQVRVQPTEGEPWVQEFGRHAPSAAVAGFLTHYVGAAVVVRDGKAFIADDGQEGYLPIPSGVRGALVQRVSALPDGPLDVTWLLAEPPRLGLATTEVHLTSWPAAPDGWPHLVRPTLHEVLGLSAALTVATAALDLSNHLAEAEAAFRCGRPVGRGPTAPCTAPLGMRSLVRLADAAALVPFAQQRHRVGPQRRSLGGGGNPASGHPLPVRGPYPGRGRAPPL